jgi:hypothetical protein
MWKKHDHLTNKRHMDGTWCHGWEWPHKCYWPMHMNSMHMDDDIFIPALSLWFAWFHPKLPITDQFGQKLLRIMLWTNGNEFEAYGWWYAHPLMLLVVKFHPKWPYSNQFGLTFRWRTFHPRGTSLSSIHVILMSSRTGTNSRCVFWDKKFHFSKNWRDFNFF